MRYVPYIVRIEFLCHRLQSTGFDRKLNDIYISVSLIQVLQTIFQTGTHLTGAYKMNVAACAVREKSCTAIYCPPCLDSGFGMQTSSYTCRIWV